RFACDALSSAGKPELFCSRRLNVNIACFRLQKGGGHFTHIVYIRSELRFFRHDYSVHVTDPVAFFLHHLHNFRKQHFGIHTLVRFISIREELADITECECSEYRVRHRMQQDIRIRMALEAHVVRDFNTADDERSVPLESMYIKTVSDSKHDDPPFFL